MRVTCLSFLMYREFKNYGRYVSLKHRNNFCLHDGVHESITLQVHGLSVSGCESQISFQPQVNENLSYRSQGIQVYFSQRIFFLKSLSKAVSAVGLTAWQQGGYLRFLGLFLILATLWSRISTQVQVSYLYSKPKQTGRRLNHRVQSFKKSQVF